MLKGLGDLSKMGGMLKQAMELKSRIEELKETLAQERISGSAGGGMVEVVVNGKMQVLSIKIEPEVINPAEPEMLTTLVQAAMNEALTKVQEVIRQRMTELTGGIEIPGIL